ncbi:MAG: AAA family ATPase [Candidatus Methanomethylophilaceae archaeon]|nr:AAA family ATPase [Candidatus Methanomethylophilaceae archaeon]MDY5871805.1 AAA family ATPase [Candidatus Methanomethylophilaceae archaeon]
MRRLLFPFVSIVGQDDMKRALLLNIVDPGIGGVLIKGEKGTAKSTTVRSLAQILPGRMSVDGCPFHCDPSRPDIMCPYCSERYASNPDLPTVTERMKVVELPLSATEDRVAGTLDIEHVLKTGEKKFEPGVLAQANGNLLYVDEVNLLDDHIVDLLLDSAAMGVNYIEREGVSFSHPSRFILVGTMNPEEGELRPQLLDRFGLSVDVRGDKDTEQRMEVVRRRLAFDMDPVAYTKGTESDTDSVRERIVRARELLPRVTSDESVLKTVVTVTTNFGIDGHRADITMMKAAKANAALEGRTAVTKDDVRAVASLVLSHRMRRRPFEEEAFDTGELERCLQSV